MADGIPRRALSGNPPPHAHLWPDTARVTADGRLAIGGLDAATLATEYGTPLYVYDEATLRAQMRGWREAIASRWPDSAVAYAAKAWLSRALCRLLIEENLELDVVSDGEIYLATLAGFPNWGMHVHGNMKRASELMYATSGVGGGVGRIVVDSLDELQDVSQSGLRRDTKLWLRINPDVATETHASIQTGHAGSKFGIDLTTDEALRAVREASSRLDWAIVGLHAHAGSQLFDTAPAVQVVEKLAAVATTLREQAHVSITEISPGGGAGVAYRPEERSLAPVEYAEAVCGALHEASARWGLPPMRLTVEPGRAIVARAGVALYTTGPRKVTPGGVIVAVDGGMGDNPRPALYGARYHAALAERVTEPTTETVQVAGRYCESGDVLVRSVELPVTRRGEVLAIPVSGAYQVAMSSSYNLVPRPAVVMVEDGDARLIQRRETFDDLCSRFVN